MQIVYIDKNISVEKLF